MPEVNVKTGVDIGTKIGTENGQDIVKILGIGISVGSEGLTVQIPLLAINIKL